MNNFFFQKIKKLIYSCSFGYTVHNHIKKDINDELQSCVHISQIYTWVGLVLWPILDIMYVYRRQIKKHAHRCICAHVCGLHLHSHRMKCECSTGMVVLLAFYKYANEFVV